MAARHPATSCPEERGSDPQGPPQSREALGREQPRNGGSLPLSSGPSRCPTGRPNAPPDRRGNLPRRLLECVACSVGCAWRCRRTRTRCPGPTDGPTPGPTGGPSCSEPVGPSNEPRERADFLNGRARAWCVERIRPTRLRRFRSVLRRLSCESRRPFPRYQDRPIPQAAPPSFHASDCEWKPSIKLNPALSSRDTATAARLLDYRVRQTTG